MYSRDEPFLFALVSAETVRHSSTYIILYELHCDEWHECCIWDTHSNNFNADRKRSMRPIYGDMVIC